MKFWESLLQICCGEAAEVRHELIQKKYKWPLCAPKVALVSKLWWGTEHLLSTVSNLNETSHTALSSTCKGFITYCYISLVQNAVGSYLLSNPVHTVIPTENCWCGFTAKLKKAKAVKAILLKCFISEDASFQSFLVVYNRSCWEM